jgi:hypothetical protein
MSKYDVYAFGKKVAFYEKRHQVKVDRKLIITPMLDPRATDLVKSLRMKVYASNYVRVTTPQIIFILNCNRCPYML